MSMNIPKPQPPQMPPRRSAIAQAAATSSRPPESRSADSDSAAAPKSSPARTAGERTRRVLLELPESQKERLAATQLHTAGFTGLRSQQAFIRESIERMCTDLESKYNGGEPYPEVPER